LSAVILAASHFFHISHLLFLGTDEIIYTGQTNKTE
jgi:hypothetical protein